MNRFWSFDVKKNSFSLTESEPLSTFPTIINFEQKTVFCRVHRRWEKIIAFAQNTIKTECGKLFTSPFLRDKSVFNYGYDVVRRGEVYYIRVQSQIVATNKRRLLDSSFELNLDKKRLFKNGVPVFSKEDISGILCKEITANLIAEMGEEYKNRYGIKPTVSSSLSGFALVLGYMLSPFNVNFYKISSHWGLNPYDSGFTELSSSDTPNAENEMFSSLGIKANKTVRKLYQEYPEGIVAYAAMKDLGFSDVNLLKKSARKDFYKFFKELLISFAGGDVAYPMRESLNLFVQNMMEIADQKTVWNSIERTVKYFCKNNRDSLRYGNSGIVQDALNMYPPIAEHLTEREKREFMREGINDYTHDFLLRRNRELHNIVNAHGEILERNEIFPLEQKFLDLEYKTGEAFRLDKQTGKRIEIPDRDRWCFYVAKDSFTLKTIGSEMSNCVGWGYKNACRDRKATIVYALYKDSYKICIEVTPYFTIRQAFGPHNSQLSGAAFDAYSEWCKEKHILRQNVFRMQVAP